MTHADSSETTTLERRVLAHERVLQALIAYMSRTEPRFVEHLSKRFVEPMSVVRHEHDYQDTDDYAEEFIRAVMLLGEKHARALENDGAAASKRPTPKQPLPASSAQQATQLERVQLRERSGIWEVKVDGAFRGDYRQKEQALAAVALLKLALRSSEACHRPGIRGGREDQAGLPYQGEHQPPARKSSEAVSEKVQEHE